MAKGKKKDKKKNEDTPPSLSKLTLSDDQPSTSAEKHEEAEDTGGLTGGKKKKEKPKKQTQIVTPSTSEQGTSQENVPMEVELPAEKKHAQPPAQPMEVESESVGLGLDLGGGRKKNPRKKKKLDAGAPAQTSEQSAPAQASQQMMTPTVATSQPQSSVTAAPPPTPWGRGATGVKSPQEARSPPTFVTQPSSFSQPPPQVPHVREPYSQPATSWRSAPAIETKRPQDTTGYRGTAGGSGPMSPSGPASTSGIAPSSKVPTHTQSEIRRPQFSAPPESTVSLYKIPPKIEGRPVPSTNITVLANYLKMTIQPLKIHRYDVTFKPDRPKKFIPKAFSMVKEKFFRGHYIAFDQMKNCYAMTALPNVTAHERFATVVEIIDNNGKSVTMEVSLKSTGIVDLGTIKRYMETGGTSLSPPTEAIQCVDVILRQGTLESYIKAGRQFFKRPRNPIDLGEGMEMWTGLFQSAIFTSQAFINIDVAHKGFPKHQSLIDLISHDFQLELNRPIEMQRCRGSEAFQAFIKGVKVMASIGGDASGMKREFICNGLVDPPAKLYFSAVDDKGVSYKISVGEYFAKEKNYRIKYPQLNCMWVGPKEKNIFYPMELLFVSYGQPMNRQLNEMQLSKMVREAATPPNVRKKKIEEVIQDMNYSDNVFFKKFGMSITNKFLTVDAKVLRPPRIEVGGATVEPRRGAWMAKRLYRAERLDSWGCIAVDPDPRSNFEALIDMIPRVGNDMGMIVNKPAMLHFNVKINELQRILHAAQDKQIKFLFVVLSTRGRDYYHRLKRMAERDIGVLTQCIKEFTATRKLNEQTVRNILLKVNSKLMGINHVLDSRSVPQCLRNGKVMLVGADVTHPSPDQSSIPSIAAVTASIDPTHFMYNVALSVQTPKKEMIVDFEDMIFEHLTVYEKKQNDLPSKIYMFRDGVSEGQFAQVMNSELKAIYNAFRRKVGPHSNRKVEVLFLLVQKRHHTRLFLGSENIQNVDPGTVVDSVIVHARELDFYLVSHQAIKGTARPTRYHAVCNDGGIPVSEVEQLAFYLCHLYSRCSRSVSYPTPTYYAHLACNRAKSLTYGDKFNHQDLEKKPQRLSVMQRMLESSPMFFV